MSNFVSLNDLPNLKVQTYKVGDRAGKRKLSASRNDLVGEKLAECATPSDLADFASSVGITEKEIADRASRASNFGNFRMTLGNRIRSVINILERAAAEGKMITNKQAAAKGAGKLYADPEDLPPKKVPAPSTAKKEAKPKKKREKMTPPPVEDPQVVETSAT